MRWNKTVRGGEARDHRYTQREKPNVIFTRSHIENRNEQDKTDAEKHRQPNEKGNGQKCPWEPFRTEKTNQFCRDNLRAARFGKDFAEDRSKADDHGNRTEHTTDA